MSSERAQIILMLEKEIRQLQRSLNKIKAVRDILMKRQVKGGYPELFDEKKKKKD